LFIGLFNDTMPTAQVIEHQLTVNTFVFTMLTQTVTYNNLYHIPLLNWFSTQNLTLCTGVT